MATTHRASQPVPGSQDDASQETHNLPPARDVTRRTRRQQQQRLGHQQAHVDAELGRTYLDAVQASVLMRTSMGRDFADGYLAAYQELFRIGAVRWRAA